MKSFISILLLTQLVSGTFAAKKGVKSVNAKKILARATSGDDNFDFENMDIHEIAKDMQANDQIQNYEFSTGNGYSTDPAHYLQELSLVLQTIDNQKPIYAGNSCDAAELADFNAGNAGNYDCAAIELFTQAKTYTLYEFDEFAGNLDHHFAGHSDFNVYAAAVCSEFELNLEPYTENEVIRLCLSASSTAKKFASEIFKTAAVGAFGANYQDETKYKCQHMLINNDGTMKLNEEACIDLDEGSNLVKCFFQLREEFQMNLNYECFLPSLWNTWYESFLKVEAAMRAKNYAISTDNMQSRYCYWRREEHCDYADSTCGTLSGWGNEECVITYADYCQAANNGWTWPNSNASSEFMTATQWIQNHHPATGDLFYGYTRDEEVAHICSERNPDDGNFSPNWLGRVCNKSAGDDAYIQCILDYPKGVIEKMLSDGAQTFPEVQFEMKSPTTMIMVGFNQQCKRHYGATTEEPQAVNVNWTACMTTKFGTTDVEDVDNFCSHYTINKMHMCLHQHAGCATYADDNLANLTDAQKEAYSVTAADVSCTSPDAEIVTMRSAGGLCDPMQFKDLCLEEKWNGWNFDRQNAGEQTYDSIAGDGQLTSGEVDGYLADGINSNLASSIHEALGIQVQHTDSSVEPSQGADLDTSEVQALNAM